MVRIGPKYDIYWDIFRDYLNLERVPVQENYIFRTQAGSVLAAIKLLAESNGSLQVVKLRRQVGLSEKTFYNLAREMRLLGIAKVSGGSIELQVTFPIEEKAFESSLRSYLRDRIRRNRLVCTIMESLGADETLSIDAISELLSKCCPYIVATSKTWRTYARILMSWLDAADLAILDSRNSQITLYTPGKDVRERHLLLAKRRGGIRIPCVQYGPVEEVASRLALQASKGEGAVDWTGFRKSTIAKALATLEDMQFITQKVYGKSSSITILPKMKEFITFPEKRHLLFAEAALAMRPFAIFVDILKRHEDSGRTLRELADELTDELDANWKDSTAETNVKIMLNWARNTQLAPGLFARRRRGSRKGWKQAERDQIPLL